MADEHRRVEPRGVVGSGMLTDPERIEQLEHDRDRRERNWRDAPKRKFGEVLTEAPARLPDDEEAEASALDDRRRRQKQPDDNQEDRAQATGEGSDEHAAAAPAPVDVGDEAPLPKVPPDPRMARLHAMLSSTTNKSGRKR